MIRVSAKGFTLLELLVSLAIFALLASMAYAGLSSALRSQEASAGAAESLRVLQLTYRTLQRDLEQAVDRGVRDEYGEVQDAMQGTGLIDGSIEFTRAGWSNPTAQPRASLQRVAWGVQDEELLRRSWLVLDRAQDSAPREQLMLEGVTAFELRYLDASDQWLDQWPPLLVDEAAPALPRAIEITLEKDPWKRITWLFRIGG